MVDKACGNCLRPRLRITATSAVHTSLWITGLWLVLSHPALTVLLPKCQQWSLSLRYLIKPSLVTPSLLDPALRDLRTRIIALTSAVSTGFLFAWNLVGVIPTLASLGTSELRVKFSVVMSLLNNPYSSHHPSEIRLSGTGESRW